ncbi:MAG: Uma2 family endonuclease [Planctomycetes bacterium]|nr:Uma2 family endonuclease [Planctomycetota bacterium]
MATTTPTTAQDLLQLPSGTRCELVAGELRMLFSPAGWEHGEIVMRISGILWEYIRPRKLGRMFGAETGFLLERNPDTVRGPDVAFVARENIPEQKPKEAFWPGAPDLAVEVLSPSDRIGEVNEKTRAWLDAGVQLLWVIDPEPRTVAVYRSAGDVKILTTSEVLDGEDVVRGFRCPVADIFPPQ